MEKPPLPRNHSLNEVCRLFSKAENSIKRYELEKQELHYPAVNQLRYAGHHLAKAIQLDAKGTDNGQVEENIKQATNHCRRAYFDSSESVLLDRIARIDRFFEKFYGSQHLSQEIPDYGNILKRTKEVQGEIEFIRTEIYEDRTDMFDKISPHLEELDRYATELDLKAPRISSLDIKKARRFLLWFSLTVLAIVISVLGILVTFPSGC